MTELSPRAIDQLNQTVREVSRRVRNETPQRARWLNRKNKPNAEVLTAGIICGCTVVKGVVTPNIFTYLPANVLIAYRWRLTGISDWLEDLGFDVSDLVMVWDGVGLAWTKELTRTCGSSTDTYTLMLALDAVSGMEVTLELSGGPGSPNCDTEIVVSWMLINGGKPQPDRTQSMVIFHASTKKASDGAYEDPPENCVFCLEPVKSTVACDDYDVPTELIITNAGWTVASGFTYDYDSVPTVVSAASAQQAVNDVYSGRWSLAHNGTKWVVLPNFQSRTITIDGKDFDIDDSGLLLSVECVGGGLRQLYSDPGWYAVLSAAGAHTGEISIELGAPTWDLSGDYPTSWPLTESLVNGTIGGTGYTAVTATANGNATLEGTW